MENDEKTKEAYLQEIDVLLAGKVAEKIFIGKN